MSETVDRVAALAEVLARGLHVEWCDSPNDSWGVEEYERALLLAERLITSPVMRDLLAEACARALRDAAEELVELRRIGDTIYADLTWEQVESYRTHPLGDPLSRIDGPESWDVPLIAADWLRARADLEQR